MLTRSISLILLFLSTVSLLAAPRRRVVQHPAPLTHQAIIDAASRISDRVTWTFHPRLHWENAVYFDGLVLFGESMDARSSGSGSRFIDRAAAVILESDDPIETVSWGDGTAFGQAAMDLYRVLPPSDPRRTALLQTLSGPLQFAEHAVRAVPGSAAPRDPWWITGGYGARFWQDDLYMVVPWLSLLGSAQDGLPANDLARNLAYEWIEAYAHDHRPLSDDPSVRAVPSERSRRAPFLLDETTSLFHHDPESVERPENFWGRGNGWALVAWMRAAESLDAPYTGGRYDQVISAGEMRTTLQAAAASLLDRRTPDGGWGSDLSHSCGVAETSATALLTFVLARGVNQGWLDRSVYVPVVMRAFKLLLRRVDASGVVAQIQPPGIGPDCGAVVSSDHTFNVNYGPGALLLAASEVLHFSDAELRR